LSSLLEGFFLLTFRLLYRLWECSFRFFFPCPKESSLPFLSKTTVFTVGLFPLPLHVNFFILSTPSIWRASLGERTASLAVLISFDASPLFTLLVVVLSFLLPVFPSPWFSSGSFSPLFPPLACFFILSMSSAKSHVLLFFSSPKFSVFSGS